jgi:hypothetical protein
VCVVKPLAEATLSRYGQVNVDETRESNGAWALHNEVCFANDREVRAQCARKIGDYEITRVGRQHEKCVIEARHERPWQSMMVGSVR